MAIGLNDVAGERKECWMYIMYTCMKYFWWISGS